KVVGGEFCSFQLKIGAVLEEVGQRKLRILRRQQSPIAVRSQTVLKLRFGPTRNWFGGRDRRCERRPQGGRRGQLQQMTASEHYGTPRGRKGGRGNTWRTKPAHRRPTLPYRSVGEPC